MNTARPAAEARVGINSPDSNQTNAIYSSHMADASGDHVELEKAYYMISRTKKYLNYLFF